MGRRVNVPLIPAVLILAFLTGATVWLLVRSPRFVKEGQVRDGGPIALSEKRTRELYEALPRLQRLVEELRLKDPERAISLANQAILMYRALALSRYAETDPHYFEALLLCYKADALTAMGRLSDAGAVLAQARTAAEKNIRSDLHDSSKHYPLMAAVGRLAAHYLKTGDTAQARLLYDDAFDRTADIAWIDESAERKKDEAPYYRYQSALTLTREAQGAVGSPKLQRAKLQEARKRVEDGLAVNESAIEDHWRYLMPAKQGREGRGQRGESAQKRQRVVDEAMQYVLSNRIRGYSVRTQVLRDIAELPDGFRPPRAPEDALNASKQAMLCFETSGQGSFTEELPPVEAFDLSRALGWARNVDLSTSLLSRAHMEYAQISKEDLAQAAVLLASCYRICGMYSQAKEAIEAAVCIGREIDDARIMAEAIAERGRIFEAEGKLSEAVREYKAAINEIEDTVLVSGLPALERHAFIASYRPIYDRLIRLLLQRRRPGDVGDAFRYVEAAKSRVFLDMIGNHDVHPRFDAARLGERERKLRRDLQASVAMATYGDDESKGTPGVSRLAPSDVRRKADLLDSAVRQMRELDPEWYSLRAVAPAGLPETQKLLREGEALLEYHVDGSHLYVFVISRSSLDAVTVDLASALRAYAPSSERGTARAFVPSALVRCIDDAVSGVGLVGGNEGRRKERAASAERALRSLYRVLVEPADKFLPETRPGGTMPTLIFVPDRMIHFVPFAALIDARGRHLVERYATVLVPSASSIQYLLDHGTAEADAKAVIVAGPLDQPRAGEPPHDESAYWFGPVWSSRQPPTPLRRARMEAESIERVLRGRFDVTVLKGTSASEDRFRRAIAPSTGAGAGGIRPRVLHFACHCEFDRDEPMFTMLVLGATVPDDVERDGAIEARDVMNWDLRGTDVVTLNVCESLLPKDGRTVTLSRLRAGGELVGLSRAFLYAGAASVIATLTEIPDESASTLMPGFYKCRYDKEGLRKGEALRRAQVTFMRDHPDSLDWACYVLVGDWR